ncbi:uncharacterized protein ISCGN_009545 [Ixodes scapularis]
MRANNPFVFLVQILLDIVLVPVSVSKLNAGSDAARRDTPFPSVIGGIAPTLDDSKHLIFEPGISRSFFDELLSSTVTSPFRAIKRRSETLHDIGHGSTANMRAKNPFVFLVQILLDIVLVPVSVSKLNAGSDAARRDSPFPSVIGGIAPTLDDSKHLIFEPGISRSFFDELLSSTVTSPFRAIKRRSETLHDIGHGSTANMRANNPFVFLVQRPPDSPLASSGELPLVQLDGNAGPTERRPPRSMLATARMRRIWGTRVLAPRENMLPKSLAVLPPGSSFTMPYNNQRGTCESRCLVSGVTTDPEPCGFARPRLAVRGLPVPGKRASWWLSRAQSRFGPFAAPRALPETVRAGYLNCRICPYISNPQRYFRCQRFGHGSRSCRGKETCARTTSCLLPKLPPLEAREGHFAVKIKENLSYADAKKRFFFLSKGGYAEVVRRGPAPLSETKATQVSPEILAADLRAPSPQQRQHPAPLGKDGSTIAVPALPFKTVAKAMLVSQAMRRPTVLPAHASGER